MLWNGTKGAAGEDGQEERQREGETELGGGGAHRVLTQQTEGGGGCDTQKPESLKSHGRRSHSLAHRPTCRRDRDTRHPPGPGPEGDRSHPRPAPVFPQCPLPSPRSSVPHIMRPGDTRTTA